MAQEEVVIKVGVDAKPAANSLQSLKKELKEAQAAALNGDGKAAKRVAELKDKMDDLKDSTRSLQGSGIEKTSSSLNLLGEGFRNFDFDKIKTGFKGIGSAMSAIPIFLIVEGIMYLVQNFNELSKGSGVLAKALQFVGDIISAIGDGITWLTDHIGLTNSALDEMGDKAVEMADKSKDALASQSAEYDRLAKEAKIAGKSAVEYEIAKQQAIIDTNVAILKQLLAYKEAGGELSEEQQKLLVSSTAALKAATTERKLIKFNEAEDTKKKDKESYDRWKELQDKKNKDAADASFEKYKKLKEEEEWQKASEEELAKINKQASDSRISDANYEAEVKGRILVESANLKLKEAEDEKKLYADKEAYKRTIEKQSIDAAQALSDVYFMYQLNKAKGNAAQELEIRKKAFQVNKAFQLGQAAIDGYRAVLSAYATAPPGFKIASGILAGLFAAAQVAKIAATQFNAGGGSGSVDVPSGGGGGSPSGNAPQVNTNAPIINPSTTFDSKGQNQQYQKVVVMEGDITNTQNRVAKLESQRTI